MDSNVALRFAQKALALKKRESNYFYIILGVIAIVVVSLLILFIVKRSENFENDDKAERKHYSSNIVRK